MLLPLSWSLSTLLVLLVSFKHVKLKNVFGKVMATDYAEIRIKPQDRRKRDVVFYVQKDKFDELTQLLRYCRFFSDKI